MAKTLVIVESPAKARTIAKFLGDDYVVESSVGHIRDLPSDAAEIPDAYKGEPWARLGVDVNNDFKPLYVINRDKKSHVAALKKLVKGASELYLATDEDREGEAIAWHLLEVLEPKVPVKRMVFHEITKSAIQHALDNPRDLDRRLVDAQEARRILDRLFGYEVSPVLWKKVKGGLSAGRVQSVATRVVVERERERMAFRVASYFGVTGTLAVQRQDLVGDRSFEASLVSVDGQRLATGRDFTNDGQQSRDDVLVLDEAAASSLVDALAGAPVRVRSVDAKPYRRSPAAPFTTSTLQQEAGRKLRFSAARTMSAAQRLYENGYITYMRTDSVTLSETALNAARAQITEKYGAAFVPDKARHYKSKAKNAQEAHEAIRPAGESFRTPEAVSGEVGRDEAKLYELIWKRTVASQMVDATGQSVSVRAVATTTDRREAEFGASGLTITFPGFLRAYVEGSDDPEADLGDRDRFLPEMTEGETLDGVGYVAEGHETKPPARYTEASLVKHLEELGVGRPSTYASIISTIQNRGYVWKKGSALVPHFTAFAVTTLLEQHFPDLVDYAFTARMEDDLDEIAGGLAEPIPWLHAFYFGADGQGLHEKVNSRLDEIDARAVNSIPIGVSEDGELVVAKPGRYGPYVQRGEDTASIPDDIAPDELTLAKAIELLEAPNDDRVLGTDPVSGLPVVARNGRYGAYVQLGDPDDGKPDKTASLFKTMALERIELDTALRLLSLPRTVGQYALPVTPPKPKKGEEAAEVVEETGPAPEPELQDVIVSNGRYGPYVKCGKETRSLTDEDQLFTITLDECVALLKTPKARGRAAAKPPLKEVGIDPDTERAITIKDGRFGPYVTDGETNASLRKADEVEKVDLDRALELLAERRAKVGTKKATKKKAKKATKKTAKKTAKKATKKTAKKTAKKATSKKATAKKADG